MRGTWAWCAGLVLAVGSVSATAAPGTKQAAAQEKAAGVAPARTLSRAAWASANAALATSTWLCARVVSSSSKRSPAATLSPS